MCSVKSDNYYTNFDIDNTDFLYKEYIFAKYETKIELKILNFFSLEGINL